MNRNEVFSAVRSKLELELNEIEHALNALINDLANETKSSAGDKYETAREMIQQERQQLETAKLHKQQQLSQINRLTANVIGETSETGAIVETNLGLFLLGVPIGKIELTQETTLFALGVQSPLSQALLGKSIGDSVIVNGRSYTIQKLY